MEQKNNRDLNSPKKKLGVDLTEILERHKVQQKVLQKMIDQIKSNKKENQ